MPYKVQTRRSRKPLFIAIAIGVAVIALGVGLVGLYATNHLPFYKKPFHPSVTGNSETKGERGTTSQSGTPTSLPENGGQDKGQPGSPSPTPTAPLMAPSGNFVSNHHPHLSNNPDGSAYLTSTCTTTSGATCQITFTKDGVTKFLPAETTDAGGSAYWNNWKLQDYGITAGSWRVQAIATLGSQTQTTNDALTLEVTQ